MNLGVTCHLHFVQNDRGLLRATAVTRATVLAQCIIRLLYKHMSTFLHRLFSFFLSLSRPKSVKITTGLVLDYEIFIQLFELRLTCRRDSAFFPCTFDSHISQCDQCDLSFPPPPSLTLNQVFTTTNNNNTTKSLPDAASSH